MVGDEPEPDPVPDPEPVPEPVPDPVPEVGLNGFVPTGFEVLLAGWPIAPVFPPPICCMSESGS